MNTSLISEAKNAAFLSTPDLNILADDIEYMDIAPQERGVKALMMREHLQRKLKELGLSNFTDTLDEDYDPFRMPANTDRTSFIDLMDELKAKAQLRTWMANSLYVLTYLKPRFPLLKPANVSPRKREPKSKSHK